MLPSVRALSWTSVIVGVTCVGLALGNGLFHAQAVHAQAVHAEAAPSPEAASGAGGEAASGEGGATEQDAASTAPATAYGEEESSSSDERPEVEAVGRFVRARRTSASEPLIRSCP